MKKLILIIFSFISLSIAENDLMNRFAYKVNLIESIEYNQFTGDDEKFNIKPMLASMAVPGLGQIMNKSPFWKTGAFIAIEAAGIAGYITWTKQADKKTGEFKRWADEHWIMENWVNNSAVLLNNIQIGGYPSVDDVIIDGSHHITIIVDGAYRSSDILVENPNIEYVEVRDWDFYEGIGKYDQFVAGWDDALDSWQIKEKKIDGGNTELIVMTPNKQHYLNLRNDSNILYRNAKFALTAVAINHIFSALDALWHTNKYVELSCNLNVTETINRTMAVKGISLEWKF